MFCLCGMYVFLFTVTSLLWHRPGERVPRGQSRGLPFPFIAHANVSTFISSCKQKIWQKSIFANPYDRPQVTASHPVYIVAAELNDVFMNIPEFFSQMCGIQVTMKVVYCMCTCSELYVCSSSTGCLQCVLQGTVYETGIHYVVCFQKEISQVFTVEF